MRRIWGWTTRWTERLILIAGAILFAQMPMFIGQYEAHLEGHVEELRYQEATIARLAPSFKENPKAYIERLNNRETVEEKSQALFLTELLDRKANLEAHMDALREARAYSRPFYFMIYFDSAIAREAYQRFTFGVPLTLETCLWAVVGAVFAWLLCLALEKFFQTIRNLFRRKPQKPVALRVDEESRSAL